MKAKTRANVDFILRFFAATALLLFVLSCAFGGALSAPAVAADVPYIKIGSEVWLLDIETGRRIFLLPETYYAVLDNISGDYYCVTFNGVSGKVPKDSVSVTGYHTVAPGTVQEIKIDIKYNVFTEIKLKSTMDGGSEEYTVPTDGSMFFLGKYPADEMWYYVKYNENCGYLKAEYTSLPELSQGIFVPEQPDLPLQEPEPAPKSEGSITKILVITGVCVAVVAVIVVIFLPKKRGGKYYYETE